MSVKVALIPRNTKTTVSVRRAILDNMRLSHFLNERNFTLSNIRRQDILEKDMKLNFDTNNYRKILYTYFEPYD
jgi:hypothetical protein